jgi:hypothetical protein
MDGDKCLGTCRPHVIAAMHANKLVWLERNRNGYITAAHVRHLEQLSGESRDQRSLTTLEPPKNTRYSFRNAEIVTRPWDLKRLNGARSGIRYVSKEVLPDYVTVVTSCLATLTASYAANIRLPARIAHNRVMPEGNLALLLLWQPASTNGHRSTPLVLTRIDHQPTVLVAASYASEHAREREDAESRELAEVLTVLLAPR